MIYLDNSATTKPCKEAVEAITRSLTDGWANPSALYGFGFDAAKALRSARSAVAAAMGAENVSQLEEILKAIKNGGNYGAMVAFADEEGVKDDDF